MSECYYVVLGTEDAPCGFEELRPIIANLAKDVCGLDNLAQKFSIHEDEDFSDYNIFPSE